MSSQDIEEADPRTTDELISVALDESSEGAAEDALWAMRHRGTREVLEKARTLTFSESAKKRELGVQILCQLGVPDRVFAEESMGILLSLLSCESNGAVLCAIGWGLGHLRAEAGVEPLVGLSADPNPEIRLSVVGGLLCQESDVAIKALVNLSNDEDAEVRSWATFGLGKQIDADSPQIRSALVARLYDSDEKTRQEAVYGLARRHDKRVVHILLEWLLSHSGHSYDLQAAYDLGDSSLLPALLQLRSYPSVNPELLEEAIVSCSTKINNLQQRDFQQD